MLFSKRKHIMKFCSLILTLAILFVSTGISTISAFAKEDSKIVTVDGYQFTVLENSLDTVSVEHQNNDTIYNFELDKKTAKVNIEIYNKNSLLRSSSTEKYELIFDENTEYSENSNFDNVRLVDKNSNKSYNVDDSITTYAIGVPVGIPLIQAALEALLASGAAVVIGGLVYVVAEEIAKKLTEQKEYRYYNARLYNNAVVIGNGISTRTAKAIANTDSHVYGVFALNFAYARGLCNQGYRGPENDSAASGYWNHIHAYGHSAHIWFYG